MRIIVEAEGHRIVIDEADLASWALSIPSDTEVDGDGKRKLARTHISLTGNFKEDFRPLWEAI